MNAEEASVMTSIAPRSASLSTPPRPWTGELWVRDAGAAARPQNLIDLIRRHGSAIAADRDEALFYEGDLADAVYVVIAGMVRCFKLLPDGRRQIIGFYQPEDLIGLCLGVDYMYSAEAVTNVRLQRFGRARLETLLEQRPQ